MFQVPFRLSLLLSALALVALTACTPPVDPVVALAKAQQAREQGKFPEAIIELKNLLQQQPNHAEAHFLLGAAYLESASPELATEEFRAAIAHGYDSRQALPELGKSLIAREKFSEALDATDLTKVPGAQGSPEVLNVRAYAQLALRQLAAAKRTMDQAMALKPDYPDGMLTLARIAVIEKDEDAALAQVERAIALEPGNTDAWLLKGDLQRQAGSPELARAAYTHATTLAPRGATAYVNIASLEIEARNYDEADRALAWIASIAPKNVMGRYLTGLLALRKGDHAEALKAAGEALELLPVHVPSVLLAARAEIALEHPNEADRYLNIAIKLDPRNVYARRLLAALQVKQGQAAQAVGTLAPILGLPNATADPALLALAGEAYMGIGQFTRATQYFEKAAALDPKNASTRMGLGMSRMARGQTDRAIADLEAASSLGSSSIQADVMLVMTALRRKQYEETLRLLDRLEKAHPDIIVMVHNLRAAAYAGKSEPARAREELEKALRIDPAYFPAADNLAKLDLLAGNRAAAWERYVGILQKDKNQLQALLALAQFSSETPGHEKETLEWLERAEKSNPDSSAPARAKIDYYRRIGVPDKALAIAVEQRKRRPDDPDILRIIGQLLIALGNTPDAVSVLSERVVLLPRSPEAYLDLADAQMGANNPAAAAVTLRNALRVSPRNPRVQAALVNAELGQDRSDRASEIAAQVKAQLPRAPLGYVLEGDVHMADRRYSQAVALYEQGYKLHNSALVAMKIYEAWADAGKPENGEARVKQWLAENPKDVYTRRTFAYASVQRERYALGAEQYRKVLEYQPKDAVALNNLAFALHKMKDPGALKYAREAHDLAPANGMIADTLAQIQIEKGDLRGGLATLEKAVAVSPSSLEIRLHYAQALVSAGDKAKAIKQLDIVVGAGAKFPRSAEAVALMKTLR